MTKWEPYGDELRLYSGRQQFVVGFYVRREIDTPPGALRVGPALYAVRASVFNHNEDRQFSVETHATKEQLSNAEDVLLQEIRQRVSGANWTRGELYSVE